jgi:peptidoglycan hydrolase-like protein with peptidoglycan-binding domain
MSRRLLLFLLVPALVGTMTGVGLAARDWDPFAGSATVLADATGRATPSVAPTPTITATPEPTPTPEVIPVAVATVDPLPVPTAEPADDGPGYDVAAVQRQLTDLRYYVGAVDGEPGGQTTSAVMAFQKVNGLVADGVVGPQTLAALESPAPVQLQGGAGNRIEVDLSKQVLYFVQGGELQRIMPVSSGSGETYATAAGGTARSLTPVGTYTIERRIRGERNAALGTLYDPMYFYRGWAIHGSNSVPAYPASHGCVRLTRADAIWLFDRAPNGIAVILYGGTHTFTAGSGAAGTDTPAGDTGAVENAPEPTEPPAPTPEPTEPAPTEPEPAPTEPEPAPSEPEPAPTPEPTEPAPTEPEPSEPAPTEPAPSPTGEPSDPSLDPPAVEPSPSP